MELILLLNPVMAFGQRNQYLNKTNIYIHHHFSLKVFSTLFYKII
jgi:hypothetical protein